MAFRFVFYFTNFIGYVFSVCFLLSAQIHAKRNLYASILTNVNYKCSY